MLSFDLVVCDFHPRFKMNHSKYIYKTICKKFCFAPNYVACQSMIPMHYTFEDESVYIEYGRNAESDFYFSVRDQRLNESGQLKVREHTGTWLKLEQGE